MPRPEIVVEGGPPVHVTWAPKVLAVGVHESTWQLAGQPSPSRVLPSSHVSLLPASIRPLPQTLGFCPGNPLVIDVTHDWSIVASVLTPDPEHAPLTSAFTKAELSLLDAFCTQAGSTAVKTHVWPLGHAWLLRQGVPSTEHFPP